MYKNSHYLEKNLRRNSRLNQQWSINNIQLTHLQIMWSILNQVFEDFLASTGLPVSS